VARHRRRLRRRDISLGKAGAGLQRGADMSIDTMFADDGEMPPAVPAATLVIFRNATGGGAPQLLMVERAASMSFAGGAAVFPGGRVDPADRVLAEALGAADEDACDEWAARIAAVRETLEETGLAVGITQQASLEEARRARALLLEAGELAPVLTEFGWTLDLQALVPFARWRPKHREVRVFDTRFYMTDLGTGAVDLLVDATENTHLFWASAAEALELAEREQIKVIFPTRRNLERLALFENFGAALAHVAQFPVTMITPFMEEREGERWLSIPEGTGYPVTGEPLQGAMRG
jgi:8-oxo-dGTP pyrophosphatase MutT (NUDIX family)